MALTRVKVPDSEDVWGKHRVVGQSITLDNSYPTGGYSITARDLGWSEITGVIRLGGNAAGAAYHMVYDTVNSKLMAFSGGSEVANATDLSAAVVRVLFLGV